MAYAVSEPLKAPLFLLDLPIAIVVDTLYLPWDVKDSFACAAHRRAERTRVQTQVPFQRLQHACISYATNHSGRFAGHILDVLEENGWGTMILRDQRSGDTPPQIWPSGWTAPFDRISKVPENRRQEVCMAVDQASDIRYLGSGRVVSSLSTHASTYILLYLRQPLKPYGYLVGYASGSLDWLSEADFSTALSRTLALSQDGGLVLPLTQTPGTEAKANHTSDGIRQPADGSPKPSM
jgi:hypothetical protein